jgi:hypothetical protein
VTCDRCGAAATGPAGPCPACGAGTLSEGGPAAPAVEQVVRRTVDADAAKRALAAYVQAAPFRGPELDPARLVPRAVWWPRWLVDVDVRGHWQAEAGFDEEVQSTVEAYGSGGWSTRAVTETRTRWEPRQGTVARRYPNLEVPALARDDGATEAFEPGAVGDEPVLLPDRGRDDQWPLVQERLRERLSADVATATGADHARSVYLQVDPDAAAWTVRLVPQWVAPSVDEGGEVRVLLVDGVSGAASGPRLASVAVGRRWAAIWGVAALSSLAVGAGLGLVGLVLWVLLPVALVLLVLGAGFAVAAGVAWARPAAWNRRELG